MYGVILDKNLKTILKTTLKTDLFLSIFDQSETPQA